MALILQWFLILLFTLMAQLSCAQYSAVMPAPQPVIEGKINGMDVVVQGDSVAFFAGRVPGTPGADNCHEDLHCTLHKNRTGAVLLSPRGVLIARDPESPKDHDSDHLTGLVQPAQTLNTVANIKTSRPEVFFVSTKQIEPSPVIATLYTGIPEVDQTPGLAWINRETMSGLAETVTTFNDVVKSPEAIDLFDTDNPSPTETVKMKVLTTVTRELDSRIRRLLSTSRVPVATPVPSRYDDSQQKEEKEVLAWLETGEDSLIIKPSPTGQYGSSTSAAATLTWQPRQAPVSRSVSASGTPSGSPAPAETSGKKGKSRTAPVGSEAVAKNKYDVYVGQTRFTSPINQDSLEKLKCVDCDKFLDQNVYQIYGLRVHGSERNVKTWSECQTGIYQTLEQTVDKDELFFFPDRACGRDIRDYRFRCADCGGIFTVTELEDHADKEKLECQYCHFQPERGPKEQRTQLMTAHAASCEKGCRHCQKKFKSWDLQNLKRHEIICPDQKMKCSHCDTDFTITAFYKHVYDNEIQLVICPLCKWQCSYDDVNAHIMLHHDIGRETQVCQLAGGCMFSYLNPRELLRHAFFEHRSDYDRLLVQAARGDQRLKKEGDLILLGVFLDMNTQIAVTSGSGRDAGREVTPPEEIQEIMKVLPPENLTILDKLFKSGALQRIAKQELTENLQAELRTVREELYNESERMRQEVLKLKEQISRLQVQPRSTVSQSSGSAGLSRDIEHRMMILEQQQEQNEREMSTLKVNLSELELQLQASLASTHNGSFLWRIPEAARRRRDAIDERITSIYSPPFYTGRTGYKMCIRAYLNGDGSGYKTHFSVFFVLMRGEFDPLMKWPFEYKVSLILVDQDARKHIVQTFKPTAESSSFKRPTSDMNVASGCPQFSKLSVLDNPSYVKDDVLYLKCIIDTSRIFHP